MDMWEIIEESWPELTSEMRSSSKGTFLALLTGVGKGLVTTAPTFFVYVAVLLVFLEAFMMVSVRICWGKCLIDRGDWCCWCSELPYARLLMLVLFGLFSMAVLPIILSVFMSLRDGFFLKLSSYSIPFSTGLGGERFPLCMSLSWMSPSLVTSINDSSSSVRLSFLKSRLWFM